MYDCIIVGGGPAGLSAALLLGRCLRKVLVFDHGQPRNGAAAEMHGFLSRDCIPPKEFRQICREQLRRYETVTLRDIGVTSAVIDGDTFVIHAADGSTQLCRRVLLATGIKDKVPPIPGIEQFYGKTVHHCPYCDGFEHRGERIAVYCNGRGAFPLSLKLLSWSRDLVLLTDGPTGEDCVTAEQRKKLTDQGVIINEQKIARLAGLGEKLETVVFANGDELPRDTLFFSTGQDQHSDLPSRLGCDFTDKGCVPVGRHQVTNVPGLYAAGDCCVDMQLVIVAAAEGTKAAIAIHESLVEEDLRTPLS